MNLFYLWWVLVVILIRYGAEGIQGGKTESKSNAFIGSMNIPAVGDNRMHRCTTILVAADLAITAGSCLEYNQNRHYPRNLLNFSRIEVYVSMGSVMSRGDKGIRRSRVDKGVVHKYYIAKGYAGIRAMNNLGALILREKFDLDTNIAPVYEELFSVEDITQAIEDHESQKTNCTIIGWGTEHVRPPISYQICASPACTLERDSTCFHYINRELKHIDIKLLTNENCATLWGLQGSKKEDTDWHRGKLNQSLTDWNVSCHQPVSPFTDIASTTLTDEGAPILCDKEGRTILVGMHVGGLYTTISATYHVLVPGYYVPFTQVREFNESIKGRNFDEYAESNRLSNCGIFITSIIAVLVARLDMNRE